MKELPNELLDAFRGDLIRGSLRPPPPVPASEFQTLTRDQSLKNFVNKVDDFIVCFGQTLGGTFKGNIFVRSSMQNRCVGTKRGGGLLYGTCSVKTCE